jgi:hypothetical protein
MNLCCASVSALTLVILPFGIGILCLVFGVSVRETDCAPNAQHFPFVQIASFAIETTWLDLTNGLKRHF